MNLFRALVALASTVSLSVPLVAQQGQRGWETYDQYYARKVFEETHTARPRAPASSGQSPSERADWSSWNGLIESYNRRHGLGPPASAPGQDPAVEIRREEQRRSAMIAAIDAERDAAERRQLGDLATKAAEGDRGAAVDLAVLYESGAFPSSLNLSRPDALKRAFWLYHRSLEGPTIRLRLQFFGLFPALLAPGEFQRSAGAWIAEMNKFFTTKARLEVLQAADARGDVVASLVLGAWYQLEKIGFDNYPGPLDRGQRLAEAQRLYLKFRARFPALGDYFLATLNDSSESQQLLLKLASDPAPLPGDTDGALTAMLRGHVRVMLAQRMLEGGASVAAAAALLQDCAPADNAASVILGDLVFDRFSFVASRANPIALQRQTSMLSLRDGYLAYERLPQAEGRSNPYGWHRGRAHLLRGMDLLLGDAGAGRAPDRRAAAAAFRAARDVFARAGVRPPFSTDSHDRAEAEARYQTLEYLHGGGRAAAELAASLAATNNSVSHAWAGSLYARGAPGLPRDAKRALLLFRRALNTPLRMQPFGSDGHSFGNLRQVDAAEIADALADLLRAEPGAAVEAVQLVRVCLPLTGGLSQAVTYAFFAEHRLTGGPTHDEFWTESYQAAASLLWLAASRSPELASLRVEAALRRRLGVFFFSFDTAAREQLSAFSDDPAAGPWRDVWAVEGKARLAALEKITTPTGRLLARALALVERVQSAETFPESYRALQELIAAAEGGSMDALVLLNHPGTEWQMNRDAANGERWFAPVLPAWRARATARLLEKTTCEQSTFPWFEASVAWHDAAKLGVEQAPAALQRLGSLRRSIDKSELPMPPDHAAAKARLARDEEMLAMLLREQPADFWGKSREEQLNRVCGAYEKTGRTALIQPYLETERARVAPRHSSVSGTFAFQEARCLLKGWGASTNAAAVEMVKTGKIYVFTKDGIDPAVVEETTRLLAEKARAHAEETRREEEKQRLLAAEARKREGPATPRGSPEPAELFPDDSPEAREKLFAWAIGPGAAPTAAPFVRGGASFDSTRVLAQLVPFGHAGAYTELRRRANAGALDARVQLAVGLLHASYANAPIVAALFDGLGVDMRDLVIAETFEHQGAQRYVSEAIARRNHGVPEQLTALTAAGARHLTAERPFFVDPKEGESWAARLAREHLVANPDDAEVAFDLIRFDRYARIEEKNIDELTPLEAFRDAEFAMKKEGDFPNPVFVERLCERKDAVALATALAQTPEDAESKDRFASVLKLVRALNAIEPASADPLLAHCRGIGHTALRRIAPHLPAALELLEAEAKAGRVSAKAELKRYHEMRAR